jgi:transposase
LFWIKQTADKKQEEAMKHYVGIDLHSNNSFVAVIDEAGVVKFKKRLTNDSSIIMDSLKAFQDIEGVVVESTFNWYWLVDALQASGYKVHLANPVAMEQYEGLKHSDDKTDAIWLAEMLRLGILPTGYIYPKEDRALRDLLRKRNVLVEHRTALLIGLKGFIHNWSGERLSRTAVKGIEDADWEKLLVHDLNKESAKQLNEVIALLDQKVKMIEAIVISKVKLKAPYQKLQTVWGIGKILAILIMLETGDIHRFPHVGNYASYCRGVSSARISNEKRKGSGNKKNGNRYLAWAYWEAAQFMRRFYPKARAWFDRKAAQKGAVVAIKALSHKISRACYFIMRDQTVFEPSKLFG